VLVHGQQGAQRERSHLLYHDGVAGTVTLEALSREVKKIKSLTYEKLNHVC
jgi:hypothetical protein